MRDSLTTHVVSTAYEMGWAALKNGELLSKAEAEFDAFITTDQKLRYQQNLSNRRLAILVLPVASWTKLKRHLDMIRLQ